jgi:hypothetical protein
MRAASSRSRTTSSRRSRRRCSCWTATTGRIQSDVGRDRREAAEHRAGRTLAGRGCGRLGDGGDADLLAEAHAGRGALRWRTGAARIRTPARWPPRHRRRPRRSGPASCCAPSAA